MADIYSIKGKKVGSVDLPSHFSEPFRPDLIKRAVVATWSRSIQPFGSMLLAGQTSSAKFIGRRRKYGTTYGYGVSRIPRTMVRGGRRVGPARIAPHAVSGRRAHPPKVQKVGAERINSKERRKAIRSAIAATALRDIVIARGHRIEGVKDLPLVVEDALESIATTKELITTLESLGLVDELERGAIKKIRAGKGTTRGRKYKRRKSALIIVAKDEGITRSAANIPGVDVAMVNQLSASVLAPGTHPGRITVWSKGAIETLGKEDLFKYR